jgi:hypothetical protein
MLTVLKGKFGVVNLHILKLSPMYTESEKQANLPHFSGHFVLNENLHMAFVNIIISKF